MNTNPHTDLALQLNNDGSPRRAQVAAVAVRWIARAWGLASATLLSMFAFGGHEHLRVTSAEALALLLFPVGVVIGFGIAWWRELLGGLVTVGSYLLFCLLLVAWSDPWPNIYFLLFSAPGFLHIAAAILARRGRVGSIPALQSH